jgi:hypothetical protein
MPSGDRPEGAFRFQQTRYRVYAFALSPRATFLNLGVLLAASPGGCLRQAAWPTASLFLAAFALTVANAAFALGAGAWSGSPCRRLCC